MLSISHQNNNGKNNYIFSIKSNEMVIPITKNQHILQETK